MKIALVLLLGVQLTLAQSTTCTPRLCRPDKAWDGKKCACRPMTHCAKRCKPGQALHPSYKCMCVPQKVIDDTWTNWRKQSSALVEGSQAWEDAKAAGYIGNTVYGAMCVLNTIYYTDVYRRKYSTQMYAGDLQFREFWGTAAWGRVVINVFLWGVLSIFWWMTLFGYPGIYQLNFYLMEFAGLIWTIRTFALLFCQAFAIGYDKFDTNYGYHDYFKAISSWGSEFGVGELYDTLDIELEALSLAGQAVAFPLYKIGMSVWNAKMREKFSCNYVCKGTTDCERKLAQCKAMRAKAAVKEDEDKRKAPYFNPNQKFNSLFSW